MGFGGLRINDWVLSWEEGIKRLMDGRGIICFFVWYCEGRVIGNLFCWEVNMEDLLVN